MHAKSRAVVWIDHLEARVFRFNREKADKLVVRPHDPARHLHHRRSSIGSGHAAEDQSYLHDVAAAISDASAVLIVGPANEKVELNKHIQRHDPELGNRIVAVLTVDHPTDGELLDMARRHMDAYDKMRPLT